jgi:hypothetical protein
MKQLDAPDTYWTHNLVIGEGDIQGHKSLIRLHLHQSEEPTYHEESLFPIDIKRGDTRTYFHAKPYILIPRMTLTMGLTRSKADSDEIGRIIGVDVTKLQEREIGNAQAWYYPAEKALILWECYLFEPYAKKDPRNDSQLATVWQEFEKTLLKELPDTERMYTTYEPIYDREVYQAFLTEQGYRPVEDELGRVPKTEEIEQVFLLARVMYKAILGLHYKRQEQKKSGQLAIF